MKRSFIFLQGFIGPFFRTLGRSLVNEGQKVLRVNFNGGDILDWPGPETIILREKANDWSGFLAELIRKQEATDLVTYGDCRPQLRTGTEVARSMGLRCHVFEQGYIRPDFITLEDSGVNGHSLLPQSPEWYVDLASRLPEVPPIRPARYPMSVLVRHSVAYNIAKFMAQPFFAHFKNHRPFSERTAVCRWTLKVLRMKSQVTRDMEFQRKFLASGRKFFLFCLQLASDYQIRHHSSFGDMNTAIRHVLGSFSQNLPSGVDLLVKAHPEELWPSELETFTSGLAHRLGIEGRVFFTSGGNLLDYVEGSLGMVTVNSTAGMASLDCHRPTIALGKSIYAIPGVTHTNELDVFWTDPVPPDPHIYRAFRKVLVHKTQINGNFLTDEGLNLAVPKAAERLMSNGVC
jgi:capsular polysaccharide export protein